MRTTLRSRARLGSVLGITLLAAACGQEGALREAPRDDALSGEVESALEECLSAEIGEDRIDVHVVVTTEHEWVGARYTGRTDEDAPAIDSCEDQVEARFAI